MSGALRGWGPALLWAAVIFYLSSRHRVPVPDITGADKVCHFGAYALLGFLLAHGARRSGLGSAWAPVLGSLYGASDEFHQSFVPGRSSDPADWAADTLGALTGAFLYSRFANRRGWSHAPAPSEP